MVIKALAAAAAIQDGATEIDWVTNIGAIKDGNWEPVITEIKAMAKLSRETRAKFKMILETCYLKDTEIFTATQLAAMDEIDWVKTSTGFGDRLIINGARVLDVITMLHAVEGSYTQVKASGGIKRYADAERFLSLGCTRLGSSSIETLMPDYTP
jgi:deoxyribose-phosphate aldolase